MLRETDELNLDEECSVDSTGLSCKAQEMHIVVQQRAPPHLLRILYHEVGADGLEDLTRARSRVTSRESVGPKSLLPILILTCPMYCSMYLDTGNVSAYTYGMYSNPADSWHESGTN